MGRLKPGATYVYEHADGVTYAREQGAPASERFEIGRDYNRIFNDEMRVWKEIIQTGQHNSALQEVLDRAKLLFYLSKENGKT